MWLFTNAISAAIGQALVALTRDPLLVINYGVAGGLSFAGGVIFWFIFRNLDKEEYNLNDMRRNDDGTPYVPPQHSHDVAGQAPAPAAPAPAGLGEKTEKQAV